MSGSPFRDRFNAQAERVRNLEQLRDAEIEALKEQLKEAEETLLDVMGQATWHEGVYDHSCLSAYEGGADYLVARGYWERIGDTRCFREKSAS